MEVFLLFCFILLMMGAPRSEWGEVESLLVEKKIAAIEALLLHLDASK